MFLTPWLTSIRRCLGISANSRRFSVLPQNALIEKLEDRTLLAAFIVDTIDDSTTVDGDVSLREAIEAANTNSAVGDATAGDAGLDTITFDGSLSGMEITLGGTALSISENLSITGLGAGNLTIDGDDASQVFIIGDGANEVDISDVAAVLAAVDVQLSELAVLHERDAVLPRRRVDNDLE